jgi:DNA transposition AAA+ family ATPase
MSGLKPPQLTDFYRSLDRRGVTTDSLAKELNISRPTLCRIFNGGRRRNWQWEKVKALLTAEEVKLLDVALCHPWNKKRIASRPRWKNVERQFQPAA